MIKAEQLTKVFPGCVAVDGISFEVNSGEIVGLLGPNGAGKTTTLRILSAYIPATSGRAWVAGYDVLTNSLEVRRRVGYMPENVPLYLEMRVDEYLKYRAKLKGLSGRHLERRLRTVKEQCGLRDMGNRIMGHLSKGYRQRVGLADALIHDPDILILDEPTIGLDPNQIREIRELIRSLAGQHTVLLSSHILPEVEATCQRVLIMNRGRIVAAGTPQSLHGLLHGHKSVRAEVKLFDDDLRNRWLSIPGVLGVQSQPLTDGWTAVVLECDPQHDCREAICRVLYERGVPLRELHSEAATLEDVFVQLTQSNGNL